ncbi:MAG: DNA replication/repair protein RecF, partial [Gemmatimonadota bacterium]
MRLTEIGLDRFRNLRSTSIGIPPTGALLIGSNGQGKTNFLEAIHYLALFRSFRGSRHREVIA